MKCALLSKCSFGVFVARLILCSCGVLWYGVEIGKNTLLFIFCGCLSGFCNYGHGQSLSQLSSPCKTWLSTSWHTYCLPQWKLLVFCYMQSSNLSAETLVWWIFVSWNHIFKQHFIVIMTFFILGGINTNPEMIHILVSGNFPMTFNPHCLYHGLLEITATFSWIKMQSSKW